VLEVEGVTTRYGAITALSEVSLHVGEGEVVVVVGPNGAGKSTLLNTVAGLLRPASGTVHFNGVDIAHASPSRLVRAGLALVPERRRIFKDLSVEENLLLAGITARAPTRRRRADEVATLFPVLRVKWTLSAGLLSGGEAQQLAVARALMSDPRLLLLDEPTLGLAPLLVDALFDLLATLREQGRTLLVVEQNAHRALELADRGYVLRTGRVAATGSGSELAARTDLFEAFVGLGEGPA
jgi:branched-chain amino acid transport system ATP-binding protein